MAGQKLGFVGLGRMGGPMSSRLLDAGHSLCVFDSNTRMSEPLVERGAILAGSAREVASTADIVFLSLPAPDIVRSVALGEEGLIHGSGLRAVVDLSTTGPTVAGLVAERLAESDITWVDSPVSGGVAGARAGTLAVMVSCPKAIFGEIESILEVLGRVFFAGEKPGLAQVAKLANNLLSVAALALTSEAVAMATKAGIDPAVMVEIMNAGSGRNSATRDKFPRAVLPGSFDFGFSTGLAYKDIKLCVNESEALGVPMVVGAAVREMMAITNAKFGPDSDFTSIARVIEDWAGVEMRGKTHTN